MRMLLLVFYLFVPVFVSWSIFKVRVWTWNRKFCCCVSSYAYKSSKCLFFLICIYRYKLLDFCRNKQVNSVMESVRWAATVYCVSCPGGSSMLCSLYQPINYIHESLRLTDQPWLALVVAPLSSAFAVTRMRRPTTLFSCRPSVLTGPAMAAPFTSCGVPSTRVHAANGKTTMWSAASVWRANSWSTTTLPSECSETGAGNSWMLCRLPLQWSSGGWTFRSMHSERANVDWINVWIWEATLRATFIISHTRWNDFFHSQL